MKLGVISAVVIVLSVITLVFGYFGYPVRSINDAAAYIVPAIRMAEFGTLDSPLLWTGDHALTSGTFLVQMPLFPVFLHFFISLGASFPPPVQAFMAIAIVNVIVIAISAWVLYKVATANGKTLNWFAVIIICAMLFLTLRASWSFGGRMETLTRLFFTIGFALVLRMRWSWRLSIFLGMMLGLIATTHAHEHVFFGALIGLAYALQYKLSACVKQLALVIASGALAFMAAMQLSPNGILPTLNGLINYMRASTAGTWSLERNIISLFESPYVILYGVIGVLFVFFGARLFVRAFKARQIASPTIFILSVALMFAYVAFVVINGHRLYSLSAFLLIVFAAFLYYVIHIQASKFIKYSAVSLFALLAVVSMKNLALFPFFLKDGKTLPVARAEFRNSMAQSPGSRISLGGPRMWALSESYDGMISGDLPPGSGSYIWLQEEEAYPDITGKLPEWLGVCTLRDNFYTAKVPRLFGFELAPVTPGYGFATYDCRI